MRHLAGRGLARRAVGVIGMGCSGWRRGSYLGWLRGLPAVHLASSGCSCGGAACACLATGRFSRPGWVAALPPGWPTWYACYLYPWVGPSVAVWQLAYLHSGCAWCMGCGAGREIREDGAC
eukprot:6371411-Alexandrium_andersonii.AAC.1